MLGRHGDIGDLALALAHVLEDMDHVEEVLLVAELPVARVDERRDARLLVGPAVGTPAGQQLLPLDDHVVAVDRVELDRELPFLEPDHRVAEHGRLHLVDAFDPTPGRVDEDGVVGEVLGERAPGGAAAVDHLAGLDVTLDGGFDLVAGVGHGNLSGTGVVGTTVGDKGCQTMIRSRWSMQTRRLVRCVCTGRFAAWMIV